MVLTRWDLWSLKFFLRIHYDHNFLDVIKKKTFLVKCLGTTGIIVHYD